MSVSLGGLPISVGCFPTAPVAEFMHWLYLPVAFPFTNLRLPPNVRGCRAIVDAAINDSYEHGHNNASYVYLTVRRGFVTPGYAGNRPGWHADGFGTDDLNYVWFDSYPTRFTIQDFPSISEDHTKALDQLDRIMKMSKGTTWRDAACGDLWRLTPEIVHATPRIRHEGVRTFVKVSISRHRYNLLGNSHNHDFDYAWKMHSRAEARNDPHYAGGDFVTSTEDRDAS